MTIGNVALLFRILLAAVFAVAGFSKLANLERSRKAVKDFGLPEWAANPLGLLLPLAELLVAVLLMPVATVLWGSIASIGLLVAFIVGIAINLSLGRKPECNCFGQVSSEPIGWSTLVRNGFLTSAAGVVFWDSRYYKPVSLWSWLTAMSGVQVAVLALSIGFVAAVVMGTWLALHLLRQHGRLLLRVDTLEMQLREAGLAAKPAPEQDGPPLFSNAAYFDLPQMASESRVTLHTLLAEKKPIALIFSDPGCGPCSALLPDLARWQQEYAEKLTIAVISRGTPEANVKKIGDHAIRYVLLQKDREVAAAYRSNGTPGAILVGTDGKIASSLATGSQAIAAMIAAGPRPKPAPALPSRAPNGPAIVQAPSLPLGESAPGVSFPDLNGETVELASYKGKNTLVVFWNPGCGYCAKMLPDLKLWEDARYADPDSESEMPELLVISTGAAEANRAMGLRSKVLLDQSFQAGKAFQVRGTPSAIMVDAEGRIASNVAVGAPAILALANSLGKPAYVLSPAAAE